ncbi:unnamed protein product [Vitrella brassicaformis CCMP3155]|uniref:Uncharacterized protein n=1 Tax=Vitrella brassicaformis (strain CCMP3155) TaxID=1169540 RepID=A0A0G4GZC1_VITBC|nr:unnamed protein product [Vitrella brassicaformis CCMP3155]|mmetsp:Transcript_22328/g.63769  ORF Transcript_22328/g.63769 Transcript_22328/m.63769 type:complete len:189 (-) Transcript_22328:788-1354(-)|eukprot:CEM36589.1 unnamed protein product [Vitrella brassicaformis CCMP3155]
MDAQFLSANSKQTPFHPAHSNKDDQRSTYFGRHSPSPGERRAGGFTSPRRDRRSVRDLPAELSEFQLPKGASWLEWTSTKAPREGLTNVAVKIEGVRGEITKAELHEAIKELITHSGFQKMYCAVDPTPTQSTLQIYVTFTLDDAGVRRAERVKTRTDGVDQAILVPNAWKGRLVASMGTLIVPDQHN